VGYTPVGYIALFSFAAAERLTPRTGDRRRVARREWLSHLRELFALRGAPIARVPHSPPRYACAVATGGAVSASARGKRRGGAAR